jgi:hypothetical protein
MRRQEKEVQNSTFVSSSLLDNAYSGNLFPQGRLQLPATVVILRQRAIFAHIYQQGMG